jgi:hypothetical protein
VPTLARCILAISISSRPQHDGLRGQSWSGLSSLSSLLFSPGTARTAHHQVFAVPKRRLLYYHSPRLYHYYSQPTDTDTDTTVKTCHCCSALRASKDSAICTEIRETNCAPLSHHPLRPSQRSPISPNRPPSPTPIRTLAPPASQPAHPILRYATRLDLKSPRPNSPTLQHTLETLDCSNYAHRDCAPTRMRSSSN